MNKHKLFLDCLNAQLKGMEQLAKLEQFQDATGKAQLRGTMNALELNIAEFTLMFQDELKEGE